MTKKFDLSQNIKGEDKKTDILITMTDIVHPKMQSSFQKI